MFTQEQTTADYTQLKQAAQIGYDNAMPADRNGLMRLADQISEAAAQVHMVSDRLSTVALGIHGPRLEPVGAEGVKTEGHDNLSSRVSNLLDAVNRLQRSYESIVR